MYWRIANKVGWVLLVVLVGLACGGVGYLSGVRQQQQNTARERDRALKAEQEANDNLKRAVAAEKKAKENLKQAEANLKLARQAVDETFDLAKNNELLKEPGMQG